MAIFNKTGNGEIRGATSTKVFLPFMQNWSGAAEIVHVSDQQGSAPANEYDGVIYGRNVGRTTITLLIQAPDGRKEVSFPYGRDLPITVENKGDSLVLSQPGHVVTLTKKGK